MTKYLKNNILSEGQSGKMYQKFQGVTLFEPRRVVLRIILRKLLDRDISQNRF